MRPNRGLRRFALSQGHRTTEPVRLPSFRLMNPAKSTVIRGHSRHLLSLPRCSAVLLPVLLYCWTNGEYSRLAAAEPAANPGAPVSALATNTTAGVESNAASRFSVSAYTVVGNRLLSTNALSSMFSRHTGTNVSLEEIVKAASELQSEYRRQGFPTMSVAFAREQITNGIVTLNVFQTAVPQIVVSGVRYLSSTNLSEVASQPSATQGASAPKPMAASAAATNTIPPAIRRPTAPASPEQIAEAQAALQQKMAELEAQEKDTRIHVVSTNGGPRFDVEKYLITGNSVLPPKTLGSTITNIDGAFGTNVSFEGIRTVVEELQRAYRDRGYVTVAVALPQQKLMNTTVKVQVSEGRLAAINVVGNHHFSSNNVMRSLPSLHTNMVLNGPIFQAELNRANANQDRQIYPVIGPGPEPGTSDLTLKVKDQLPVHAKVEFNNENSPGTPDLRINGSAVYNDLWQLEHSLGVQYAFSPEQDKPGNQSPFYDSPAVANYGGFYRLPLGNPEPIEDIITSHPGSFGYDEATRRFNLPPPTGRPDLTFFASRSTIDTGLTTTFSEQVTTNGSNPSIFRRDVEESPTVNQDLGARLSFPLQASANFQSGFSGGLEYKRYVVGSYKTNIFTYSHTNIDTLTMMPILPPIVTVEPSAVPTTINDIEYLPLLVHYDASWRTPTTTTSFGLALRGNVWYSSDTAITTTNVTAHFRGTSSLQQITGSSGSTGYWVIINPNLSQTFMIFPNWITSIRVDGQWASEPLISNEQYGLGGINTVRGYHEGEVFGDNGWHLSLEEQTPPHVVGMVHGRTPLSIRALAYLDSGAVFLLDPQGRPGSTTLCSTGFGFAALVGSQWEAKFLFSVPLISTSTTPRDQLYFNFALSGQF
jgi:hemolysin activation/secretion protein